MQKEEKRGSAGLALKAGFWYVISTFLVKGLSFITTPIFSRLLSHEAYGEFSNFASWQAILLIITSAEMQNTVARAYYDYKEDFDGYVSSVTIFSCGFTMLFYILFLLCGDWIYNIVSIPKEFVHILFFMLMFQACKQIYMARERTLYRYKSVAAISVVNLLVPTLIAVVLVLLAQEPQRLAARIYGFYVPSALIGVGCAAVMLWRGRSFSWKHCKYAIVLSIPLMMHYLTAQLLTSSNTVVTKLVLGAEAVSYVSIASSTNHILTILLQAVSGAVTTWLMDNMEQQNTKMARKGTLLYVAGIAVVSIGVMLLAPELIWLLGSSKYADSVMLMPGMVTAVFVQSVTTILTIMLTFRKKVVKTAVFTGVVSVLGVAAKYFLLPHFGVQILPVVNIAAFGTLLVINYFLVRSCGDAKFINLKAILAVVAVVLLVMVGSFFLYESNVIRYCVIAVVAIAVLIVLYRYRKLVIKLVKSKLGKKKKNANKTMEE